MRAHIAAALLLLAVSAAALTDGAPPPQGLDLYRSWTHALPPSLFARMESDCRAMHRFDANSPVLKDGKRVTRWFPAGAFPRTALEEAILHLSKLASPGPRLVGYEWWIQQIRSDGPLSFHVDKDESVASNEQRLLHPLWSSVFYVTDVGGGTLLTNQHSPRGSGYEPREATEGAWSFPARNKFLRFNGTLLHGVVPLGAIDPEAPGAGQVYQSDRITFLVNFWHVRPKEPNCQLLRHEEVPGLKVLSREQIMDLRAQAEAEGSRDPIPQPLITLDLRSGREEVSTVDFRMDLPGRQEQTVRLPLVRPVGGETYQLHWRSTARAIQRARKVEKRMRKEETQALASSASSNQSELDVEEEAAELVQKAEKPHADKKPKKQGKKKSSKKTADEPAASKSTSTASQEEAAKPMKKLSKRAASLERQRLRREKAAREAAAAAAGQPTPVQETKKQPKQQKEQASSETRQPKPPATSANKQSQQNDRQARASLEAELLEDDDDSLDEARPRSPRRARKAASTVGTFSSSASSSSPSAATIATRGKYTQLPSLLERLDQAEEIKREIKRTLKIEI